MRNKNALIALAYIRESKNPLMPFCNYILYCLTIAHNNILGTDAIAEMILNEFGLKMSSQLIKTCIRILRLEKKIQKLSNKDGIRLTSNSFDVDEFEKRRSVFKEKEDKLINGLVDFTAQWNVQWTHDEARDHLARFLIDRGNATRLFIDQDVELVVRKHIIQPEWYVGMYIFNLKESETDYSEYLVDVVNGLMIYVGVHLTNDYEQDKNQKFKGTSFYIDTKLLLRILGYSWNLEVKAANELVDLIKEPYGGIICVFEHTVGELVGALSNAANQLKRGVQIRDVELRKYADTKGCNAYDFELYSSGVRKKIEQMGFRIEPTTFFGDSSSYKYSLDWKMLDNYIKSQNPDWREGAIHNDVDTIQFINMLRKGNYSEKFGGRKKLPVFITSNTALVQTVRNYILECGDLDSEVANWSVHALPIITDNMIMFRLWLPVATSHTAIPRLTLARNAYAAQLPRQEFYDKLKATADELDAKHGRNIELTSLTDMRRMQLEEILIKNTSGNIDSLEPEVLAISIDELIALETSDLRSKIVQLCDENSDKALVIAEKNEQIIKSAAARYRNKLGLNRLLVTAAKSFWFIMVLIFGSAGVIVETALSTCNISNIGLYLIFSVPLAFFLIEKVLERASNHTFISAFLLKKAINTVWRRYSQSVANTLEGTEVELEKGILDCCFTETPLFNKYQRFIDR